MKDFEAKQKAADKELTKQVKANDKAAKRYTELLDELQKKTSKIMKKHMTLCLLMTGTLNDNRQAGKPVCR